MSRLSAAPRVSPVLTAVGAAPVAAQPAPAPVEYRGEGGLPVDPPQPPTSADSVGAERPERKEKVGGWYGYPSNLARIRAAWFHTQTAADGWPSLSDMTEQLLLREAERLEREHNDGQPFPEVPAGKVRHSRRPGS